MNDIKNISPGFEFPEKVIQISEEEQRNKLSCCDIDGYIYGNEVDITMLGLPTLEVLMAADIPVLGAVHLFQKFHQHSPFILGEAIIVNGKIREVLPHERGCILNCDFRYMDSMGNVRVEAQRSGIVPVGAKAKSQENFRPSEQLEGFLERNRYLLNPKKVTDFSSEAGNLIHSDPEVAKQHGFRAPIAAGLMGLHFYRKFIAENFETKSFDLLVWFRRPMFWDDELSLVVREVNSKRFDMHLLGSNGKPTSNCELILY